MLYGRQDAADWIDLQLTANHRTMVLSGVPLVGKTSFLRHVTALQLRPSLNVIVSLTSRLGEDNEPSLNEVLRNTVEQIRPQLVREKLLDAQYRPESSQVSGILRELLAHGCKNIPLETQLVYYFDDLHQLVRADLALVAGFLSSLMPLLDECPALYLVFTANQEQLKQIHHPLIDGAPVFNLGPLPSDAAISMITEPVTGILRFDYGVTRRIAETCSNHPYYLSLYCHTLLNRQVYDGWVNQQDFDTTLTEILESSIEPFTDIWEKSTWPERAVLTGMAAIQGAHGPITGQEIIRSLERQNPSVESRVIMDALKTLADRGVLVPMGAVSYRFHVELLRYWLRLHTSPGEIISQVNWGKAASQLKPAETRTPMHTAPRQTATKAKQRGTKRSWLWPVVVSGLLLCGLGTIVAVLAVQVLGIPVGFMFSPTPTPTATATPVSVSEETSSSGGPVPSPTAFVEATPTASPTPALVVARSLPSITYMARDIDQTWRLYVMDADGSNQTALTPEDVGDDTSPIWSPDGNQIAFVSRRDGNREIYVMDTDGDNVVNVTRHPADDWTPAWSPDGTSLAFASFRAGSWEIYVMDTACLSEPGSCPDAVTQVTNDGNGNLSPAWYPDGSRFAFNSKANGNWDIYTMDIDGTNIQQITSDPENDLAPVWSPDGGLIAFESNREGNVEIFVVDANGGTAQNLTNEPQADDHGPVWSPDGRQLVFYSNREGNWDIFSIQIDGTGLSNLTNTPTRDEQTPAWRP
jgi:Tol biopolymer transport system component